MNPLDPTQLHPAECRTCGRSTRDSDTLTDGECWTCVREGDADVFEDTLSLLTDAANYASDLPRIDDEQHDRLTQQIERLQRAVGKMERVK